MSYDPSSIISAYDSKAQIEDQAEKSGALRVTLPRVFIQEYLQAGDVVLDAGGGTGINAIAMARRCQHVTLLDISPRILQQAERNVQAARVVRNVELLQGDITDLSRFADGAFTFVVCVGDALSYALDRRTQAIAELVRVAREGATLIIGCASRTGYMRHMLAEGRLDEALAIYKTGWGTSSMGPRMYLYTVEEMRALLKGQGCKVLKEASTPTMADTVHAGLYDELKPLQKLEALERELCTRPELLGMGLHMLFVVQKKAPRARQGQRKR